ncbi:MAG: D-alanyl-D-alanine carboxypeptidase, partial [Williamsia herbipolensis]|nr:D-alanyl-D-alanine carboxypeptidase [Williamsia herbipolensis]
VLAESLLREVAAARGAPRSFTGATAATRVALQDLGIPLDGITNYDGSGMSDKDRVSPDTLARIIAAAVSGKVPSLRYLLTGLPVAGLTGTLGSDASHQRFDDDRSAAGRGWVRAKTGSLNSTLAIAGYVPDEDGRLLVFALITNASISGNDVGGTRAAQDWFAATLRQCGCR